jgi:hypothetical protein
MITIPLRHACTLAVLALGFVLNARAEQFTGTTTIDFNAGGYASYNLSFYADVVVGGDVYAYSNAGFADVTGSSYSFIGEAEVDMYFSNIHKVGSQWRAETVTILEFDHATGNYDWRYLYDYALPSSATVWGSATCQGYTQDVRGSIEGYGTPANNPPSATVDIPGHPYGTSVAAGTSVTVNFGATDGDGNLSGIRYNAYNASTGYLDNNGGAFIGRSGSSGSVSHSFTLSQGEWYFWTEAQDTAGASASSPGWTSGYHLTVTSALTYCTPAYEPSYWNGNSTILWNNNCYNYANNKRTDTFAQPGRASGNMYGNINGTEVGAGAVSDGLEPTDAWSTSPQGKTKIALVIWPDTDFHWYRQDSNGLWTHKPGGTQATNLDNSGQPITNPATADRGPYTEFIGYYFTPSSCVQGAGYANIQ